MHESFGAKLRQAREQRRLTLQQVSESTKVRPHYLQALENDDLSTIPSAAQARGFLHIYAGFLGLDLAKPVLAVPPAEPAPPVATSSESPPSETPNPEAGRPFHVLAWAGERWSQRAGKPASPEMAARPDPSAQSEALKTGTSAPSEASKTYPSVQTEAWKTKPSAQGEALKTDAAAPSEALKTDPSAQREAWKAAPSGQSEPSKTESGESISSDPGKERVERRSRIPAPLESKIREMFRDATVEQVSSSPDAAGEPSSQPERGPRGAVTSAPLPADTKKKAVM